VIDTHAHLDALDADPTDALARARATGVWQVISVGTDIESCHKTLDLAEREEGVSAVLGLHPHEAGAVGAQELAVLEELLEHPKAVGVGETGLDYYRDYAPRDRQRELFESHCELAVRTGKALVIHSRAAEEDTAAVLRQLPRDARVVMHCFSSPALLDPALEHGWFISFAGNVTYPNASQLRTASTSVPADRLLAETDSPYLLPEQHPVRRARNEPAYVIYTLRTLAEARGLFDDELERIIEANASAAFDLP
jgi:TatD DNase family protein